MKQIPPAPLSLGLAGLIPFLWGAVSHLSPALARAPLPEGLIGTQALAAYGLTILAFMSGVLWGFASRDTGPRAAWGYVLSVLPALWGFFTFGAQPARACLALAAGFLVLLPLDFRARRQGLAPPWWPALRLLLTAIVVPCLLVGALG